MSLLSSIIIQRIESDLVALEHDPDIAEFLIRQVNVVANDVIAWTEEKLKSLGVKNEA